MRPIIRSATHNKVRRDPILGRDPWFENPGFSPTGGASGLNTSATTEIVPVFVL